MLARSVGMKGLKDMAAANFKWEDPLLLDEQLTTEEKLVRDAGGKWRTGRLDLVLGGAFDLLQEIA